MQKLRLQNTYNKETNSFDRDKFEVRETDGTISGKVSISTKKGDKWVSKPMPFTAFKSRIDVDTIDALLYSNGQVFEADISLTVDSFTDRETNKEVSYFKIIINEARSGSAKSVDAHSKAKGNGYAPESDLDEEGSETIPF